MLSINNSIQESDFKLQSENILCRIITLRSFNSNRHNFHKFVEGGIWRSGSSMFILMVRAPVLKNTVWENPCGNVTRHGVCGVQTTDRQKLLSGYSVRKQKGRYRCGDACARWLTVIQELIKECWNFETACHISKESWKVENIMERSYEKRIQAGSCRKHFKLFSHRNKGNGNEVIREYKGIEKIRYVKMQSRQNYLGYIIIICIIFLTCAICIGGICERQRHNWN